MPVSKAQQKAQNKWIAKAYDRINLTVPKGKKDIIQAHAQARGESVNAFINRAIDYEMERDGGSSPQGRGGAPAEPAQLPGTQGVCGHDYAREAAGGGVRGAEAVRQGREGAPAEGE